MTNNIKYHLNGNSITNLSFKVETDAHVGDIIPNSFNYLRPNHKDEAYAEEYKALECRQFETIYPVFTSSSYVTGKLLLVAIVENLRIRGIEINAGKKDTGEMTRDYSVSVDVDKFMRSIIETADMIDSDMGTLMILESTKIGLLFDEKKINLQVHNKKTTEDFISAIKSIAGRKSYPNKEVENMTHQELLNLILKYVMLIFVLAMIPIKSIRIENFLASNTMVQPDSHNDDIHIFDKMLYGFEFFELIEFIMYSNSKDKDKLKSTILKSVKEPYSSKYTTKTTINPFRTDAASYITCKREYHKANSLSFSLFSFDKLRDSKSYETKGDTSIKKLLDPPVFIDKNRHRFSKYEDKESATLNIFFNADSMPDSITPAPILELDIDKFKILADPVNSILDMGIFQLSVLEDISDNIVARKTSKRLSRKFNIESIRDTYDWALKTIILDKLDALDVNSRRIRNLLKLTTLSGIEGLIKEEHNDTSFRNICRHVTKDTKLNYTHPEGTPNTIEEFLKECNRIIPEDDTSTKLTIVTSIIHLIVLNIRSTTIKAMLFGYVKEMNTIVCSIIGLDMSSFRSRNKILRTIMETSLEMTLINNFNMRFSSKKFISSYVIDISNLRNFMWRAILKSATV